MCLAACGHAAPQAGTGRTLGAGERPAAGASGLRVHDVLARGALVYDVAAAHARVATIELETGFALVVRDQAGTRRTRLGDATYDFVSVALDGAGGLAAVAGLDGTVRLFALAGPLAERARWRLDDAATAVALSPDGSLAATGAASGVLCLRRTADGALLQCVAEHEQRVSRLVFSADGRRLASAGWDGRIVWWEVPSLRVLGRGRRTTATAVAISPDGNSLAEASSAAPPSLAPDGHLRDTGPHWLSLGEARTQPGGATAALAFTLDGRRLLAAGWDGALLLLDAHDLRVIARLAAFPSLLRGLAVVDAHTVIVAGWSGQDPDGASLTVVDLLY